MYIKCETCGTQYNIDPDKITGLNARYKCKACGGIITAIKPGAAQPASGEPADEQPKFNISFRMSEFSIRTKITLIIVLLVLAALSVVGYIASSKGSQALVRQAEAHLALATAQRAKEYNLVFERIQDEIAGVAGYAAQTFTRTDITTDLKYAQLLPWTGRGYGTSELFKKHYGEILIMQRIGRVLEGLVSSNPYIELGYMATESKITTFSDVKIVDVLEDTQGFDPTARPWYTAAKQAGKVIWTRPYVEANTKKLVVTCAMPVYRPDKTLIGVVGFDVLLVTIQNDILTLDIGYNSYAFLVNKKGAVLVRPGITAKDPRWDRTVKTANILKVDVPEFKAIGTKMVKGERGVTPYTVDDKSKVLSYAPIPGIGASVGIVVPVAEILKPATAVRKIIVGVWIGVVIVSILIGLLIGDGITKPINELTMMADLISQGKMEDLDFISEDRKDEIGDLTKSFNRLVMSLKVAMSR